MSNETASQDPFSKNPLNGQTNHSSNDYDDQDDLFVSAYPEDSNKPIAPVEDLMNTIDLNDDLSESPAPVSSNIDSSVNVASSPDSSPVLISTPPPKSLPATIPVLSNTNTQPALYSFSPDSNESITGPASSLQSSTNKPTPTINTASQIQITVSEPHKIGEGMVSYMVYTVTTKTTLPYFRRQSLSVDRRFSDFLGLHEKLQAKHAHLGRIVPPPPSKSVVGTAMMKFSKQDEQSSSTEFLSKRRFALERYLQRNAEHPIICADPDFREFLELEANLPRSTSTSALSGASVKRMFGYFNETVSKMTYKMDETDTWFEQKQTWIEQLDGQLRKLYSSVESLIHHRKELTVATAQLAKSTAILGNCEEHNSLSCALSQLASTHEKVEKIYEKQANNDFQYMAELLKEYISLIGSVRGVFHERVKAFQNLSTLEQNLSRKREQKTRLELAMKHDRIPPIEEEIRDLDNKVEKAKEDFETISANIKQEFERFDINRIRDFKQNFIRYMESLLETQESLVECWESFLPESKSIAV